MKKWYLVGVILFIVGLGLLLSYHQPSLEVNFLDVGEGDAILIKTPHNSYILIDGGPDRGILRKLGKILPYGKRRIDLVISTHPHSDHLVGLLAVLEKYQVDKIITTGVLHTTQDYLNWLKVINTQKIPIEITKAGEDIFLDGVGFKILWPTKSVVGQRVKDLNETSLAMLMFYGQSRVFLAGDIPEQIEEDIIAGNGDVLAQILKVSHQGSKNSSGADFLRAVDPDWAIISVGANNRYGHPHPETLARLKNLNITTLRTDLAGDIKFISDGQIWSQKSNSLINW